MKKLQYTAILFFCLLCMRAQAQAPSWAWAKGSRGAGQNVGQSVCTDRHSNVYVAGYFNADTLIFGTDTLFNRGTGNGFVVKYDQAGNLIWARSAGGVAYDGYAGVCTDANGNVYVTGYFGSPSFVIGTDTLTNGGGENIVIAKYDSSGSVLWAHCAGGAGSAYGSGVCADASGNVYLAGAFQNTTATFGSTSLTNSGSGSNVFIAKYDAGGNVIWAKSSTGSSSSEASSVSTDLNGNVFVSGSFNGGNVIFGSNTLTNSGSANSDDFFITKYDSSGNALWAQGSTGAGGAQDNNYAVYADASGNAYATGMYEDNIIVFGNDTVRNNAFYSAYIVKYSPSGSLLWATGPGGGNYNEGLSVAIDAGGNVYLTGAIDTTIIFGNDTLTTGNSAANIFVAKYSPSGTPVWALGVGGPVNTGANSINTDASGNIYLTGYIDSGSVAFGSHTIVNNYSNSQNFFVAKISSNCTLPSVPASTSTPAALSICEGSNTALSATGTDSLSWYSAASGGTYLGGADIGGYWFIYPHDLTTTTIYYVQDSSACGISARTPVTVTVNPKPNPVITAQGADTLSTAAYASYQWLLNGAAINNATHQSYVASATGSYQVYVTDAGGCSDTSAIYTLAKLAVTTIPMSSITIHPNPSSGIFYLDGAPGGYMIEVYNVMGEMVYSAQANAASYPLNLDGEAKGIYFYKVRDTASGIAQSGKIVLE